MEAVRRLRKQSGMTQEELARAAGTSQPTIAAYEAGTKSPTLRTLGRLAHASGFDLVVRFLEPMTREERRSLAVHEAIAERLEQDPAAVVRKARRNLRRMRDANPHAAPLLNQWARALRLPTRHLVDIVIDPSPYARELRHVTPFAGVLTAAERAQVYARFREDDAA